MVLKRQLKEGGEEGSRLPIKRPNLASSVFKGPNYARMFQNILPTLEPMIRRWVGEEVDRAVSSLTSCPYDQINCPGSRTLQLQFHSDLPHTLFTGSRIVSDDKRPVKIVLYDTISGKIITCGPLSSVKVNIVVLDGDFGPEDWTKNEFDRKLVQNREGKRPLVTGELTVSLQNGVGYIGDVSFTDNSSWIRSGKFRLGVKVLCNIEEISVREGMSNPFKVKDHRGESYQKHYPPRLDDEVWRLEKIAKDGASHKKLTECNITSVRDLLKLYVMDRLSLRKILCNISNRTWETIIRHATTCALDDKKYMYTTPQGAVLLFNSINMVVGVTFPGQSYSAIGSLDMYQKRLVEDLKQQAYGNLQAWLPVYEPSSVGYPMLLPSSADEDFNNMNIGLENANLQYGQGQHEMQVNSNCQSISPPPYNSEVEQDNSSFELGDSSHQMGGFNPTFRNNFGMTDSLGGIFNCCPGSVTPQLSGEDLPINDPFQVDSPAWQWNGLFVGPTNHETGVISANTGLVIPRNRRPKTRWCKVLAVVKWRILVRRNVAARKWNNFYM